MSFSASLDLKTLCNELKGVKHKAYEIGIQLSISHSKLMELKQQQEDFLAAALDFWLCGNIPDVPITWKFLVDALKSAHVDEAGCANRIKAKYCNEKGQYDGQSPSSLDQRSRIAWSVGYVLVYVSMVGSPRFHVILTTYPCHSMF